MEDKLKQLKFIYEGSVVDFSDSDGMAIGIVKDFRMVGGVPCAVCSYVLDIFDDDTYVVESSDDGDMVKIELSDEDVDELSLGDSIIDEDEFLEIIHSLDHSKYVDGAFDMLKGYNDEFLEKCDSVLYDDYGEVLKPYVLKDDVDISSADDKNLYESLNGLRRKNIMFEYLGTVYVGEVKKCHMSKGRDCVEIDFKFLFEFDDDDGMWCRKNEKVFVCDGWCMDFCLNSDKILCGRDVVVDAMCLIDAYSYFQETTVDDMFDAAQGYYKTLLDDEEDDEEDDDDFDFDYDGYFDEQINGGLMTIRNTTSKCSTAQKRVVEKFMKRFYMNEHYDELSERISSVCSREADVYGNDSLSVSFYDYDNGTFEKNDIDEISLFVNYDGDCEASFYCSYGDGYLKLMTRGNLDDMLNFVWKKVFGKKITSDDGHMRYLFNVNNKVERKYFDMYVDMLEDNYSDKGVRIDRSRIDFSSSENACKSILNLMQEQVDTVYEVKN